MMGRTLPLLLLSIALECACTLDTGGTGQPAQGGTTGNGGSSAADFDVSGRPAAAINYSGYSCTDSASCECAADRDCALTCDNGRCSTACDTGSECAGTCVDSECTMRCRPGARCSESCTSGSCSLTCEGSSICELDCELASCLLDCGEGSTCSLRCSSDDCVCQGEGSCILLR